MVQGVLGNVLARVVIDKADEVPETRGGGEERTRCTAIGDCGQPSVRAAVR